MPKSSLANYLYLAYFSQPSHERSIYRDIRRLRRKSIVELGVGMGRRSERLIRVAQGFSGKNEVRYTGIDLFEARPSSCPGMTLKRAHRVLRTGGGRVQLIPGDPFSALSRRANQLHATDLVVIGADQDARSMARAWFYLPRMLSVNARVFLESYDERHGKMRFHRLDLGEVTRLAESAKRQSQRAA